MRAIVGVKLVVWTMLFAAVTHADDGSDTGSWPMYNADALGTRTNHSELTLSPASVTGLAVKWSYPTPGAVTGTPAVVGDMLYVGDLASNFYALKTDGTLQWSAHTTSRVTASAIVKGNTVIVGDLAGFIYGYDRKSGALLWSVRPNPHPTAAIWGSGTEVNGKIAFGVASNEESATRNPSYPCCSMRGSVVLLDPKDGSIVWQSYLISTSESAAGSSGASVWSTPTFDSATNRIYVTTGNNFSLPSTNTSDAILALDAKTGAIVWSNQRTPDDTWTYQFPNNGPDFDFGDSAQIYTLPDGRKVVSAGQKSGFLHVLEAATGAVVTTKQYLPGGFFGGLFSDSAFDAGRIFVNGHSWTNTSAGPEHADVIAVSADGASELWRFTLPGSANLAGVAVANGVVYFASAFTGRVYALRADTGAQLAAVPIGISMSGPSVSQGRVYIGTGTALQDGAPGSIVALGL
jgi:polyvinyl alcohol dehydrogenase (cytochrome)